MTEKINYAAGGPAFPLVYETPELTREIHIGMHLRDWFAGQALANPAEHDRQGRSDAELAKVYAARCYLLADAMLAERAK